MAIDGARSTEGSQEPPPYRVVISARVFSANLRRSDFDRDFCFCIGGRGEKLSCLVLGQALKFCLKAGQFGLSVQ